MPTEAEMNEGLEEVLKTNRRLYEAVENGEAHKAPLLIATTIEIAALRVALGLERLRLAHTGPGVQVQTPSKKEREGPSVAKTA